MSKNAGLQARLLEPLEYAVVKDLLTGEVQPSSLMGQDLEVTWSQTIPWDEKGVFTLREFGWFLMVINVVNVGKMYHNMNAMGMKLFFLMMFIYLLDQPRCG